MREQVATSRSLVPSPSGVLFVSGFGTSLRIDRGHLVIRTSERKGNAEARFPRIVRPRLRRLVVFGKGGFITFEALAWLHAVGCSFVHMSRDGTVIASSGEIAGGQPALRRAQALAINTKVGLALTRHVLTAKLDGQGGVIDRWFQGEDETRSVIVRSREALEGCTTTEQAMALEARAATAYWSSWAGRSVSFVRADLSKIPDRWLVVGERHSMLTNSPRLATSPVGALINYVYSLAEFACRLALQARGLDPEIGWLHRDVSYRASAALDLMECVRPTADVFVITLLRERTFTKREFVEMPTGHVRLAPGLAKSLAVAALPNLEGVATDAAGDVAMIIAASMSSPARTRTRQGPQRSTAKGARLPALRTMRIASDCQMCGIALEDPMRMYCDGCLPTYEAERTNTLAATGKATLRRMRDSADDPAQSREAMDKRIDTSRKRTLAIRSWERQHGKVVDREKYEHEILPAIQSLTVPALMAATGLSQHYCWQVRTCRKRLHPMHWEAVAMIARGQVEP